MRSNIIGLLALWVLMGAPLCLASENPLLSMDLEALMDMDVTTVTKRTQSLSKSAAAIYVIKQEDIRRFGATSLPEVLSLAPGVNVSRINNYYWAVSARGLMSQYANKLLVIVDGRSVYNPIFAGVYWDSLLPTLNEIERIEIIRGPGGSLWGANAVNGIINIITYGSEVTQGERATVGVGNEERGFTRLRHGFRKEKVTGRVNADFRKVDDAFSPERNTGAGDEFSNYQLSTRVDWHLLTSDIVTVDSGFGEINQNGNLFVDEVLVPFVAPAKTFGSKVGWITANWLHQRENHDSTQLKVYSNWEDRADQFIECNLFVTDIDMQYNHSEFAGNRITGLREIVWVKNWDLWRKTL